jgi:hypothetical protein
MAMSFWRNVLKAYSSNAVNMKGCASSGNGGSALMGTGTTVAQHYRRLFASRRRGLSIRSMLLILSRQMDELPHLMHFAAGLLDPGSPFLTAMISGNQINFSSR